MFARFFINKPRFATVISLVFIIAGFISISVLPIEQYPDISPPSVYVSTSYLGASADVVETSVGQVIESAVNGVDNMTYMKSSSGNDGSYSLSISFDIGTDPDLNAVNVQNRIKRIERILPQEVIDSGVFVLKRNASILMAAAFTSENDSMNSLEIGNYLTNNVVDEIARIKGVGNVQSFSKSYSMRIWMDSKRMQELSVTPQEIALAIRSQNIQTGIGKIGAPPISDEQQLQFNIVTQGRLVTAEEFGEIIVRINKDQLPLRLKDVARIELASQSDDAFALINGKEGGALMINQASGANAVEVANQVKARLQELSKRFPEGLKYEILMDNSEFVTASINEVIETLIVGFILVVLSVYIFMGKWRPTIIPMMAIPVSLIGAFAFMAFFGFTINTISLLALVLAIGLVVDDAIVVVEAVESEIEKNPHLTVKQATAKAMGTITSPVIASTLVLLSVFVPIAFVSGTSGILYLQFAFTISVAVCISTLNALTLSPALCGVLLKHEKAQTHGFIGWFLRKVDIGRMKYGNTIRKSIKHIGKMMLMLALMIIGTGVMFKLVPTAFLPDEDQGALMVSIQLPEGAAQPRTAKVLDDYVSKVRQIPGVKDTMSIIGFSLLNQVTQPNAAFLVLSLDPYEERTTPDKSLNSILGQAQAIAFANPDAMIMALAPPAIMGASSTAGVEYQLQNIIGDDFKKFEQVMQQVVMKVNQDPRIGQAFSTFNTSSPLVKLSINRDKAISMGVAFSDVLSTLQYNLGGVYVNDFNLYGRSWQVKIQAQEEDRKEIANIYDLKVRSATGSMVPMSALISLELTTGPGVIARFNNTRSITINGTPAPEYTTGDAIAAFEEIELPEGYSYLWTGSALQEKENAGQMFFTFVLAFLFAYLFLVAQYESWVIPASIMLSIFVGLFGGLTAMYFTNVSNNIYSQIGMITLIALAAKNAILIVEYAMLAREEGKIIEEAAAVGGEERLRAILMTAFSTIAGSFPLIIATGAGAGSRVSVGMPMVAGMTLASTLGIFFIPVIYVFLARIVDKVYDNKNQEEEKRTEL